MPCSSSLSTHELDVQNALLKAKAAVAISLRALSTDSSTSSSSSHTLPPLTLGISDAFAQLLTSLRHTTTTVALSFKPPVTPEAATRQISKLAEEYGRSASCVIVASAGRDWEVSALVSEWREGVLSIGQEIQRFLDVLLVSSATTEAIVSGSGENPYLIHTGMVWEAIDRLAKELSRSEVDAAVKRWEGQKEVVKDAWTEFKEALEEALEDPIEDEDGRNADAGEDEENDWGELERTMRSGGSGMTSQERATAEAAKSLLGLHQILHATLPRYLLLLSHEPEVSYKPLLDGSAAFVAAFDTAISAMYPDQDEEEINRSLGQLTEESLGLVRLVEGRLEGSSDVAKREQCRTFLNRWRERLKLEDSKWSERRLSLSSLKTTAVNHACCT